MRALSRWLLACGLVWLAGCITGINEDQVMLQTLPGFERHGEIRKVAVIPFGNYLVSRNERVVMGVPFRVTEENGVVMGDIFAQEFERRMPFKVIAPDRVADFFKKRREKVWGLLNPKEVQRAGELLKCDALVTGQVRDFSTYRYRQHKNSRVMADIRMADTVTGEPIWRGSIKLDQEGMPHEVAMRGARLLIDQLMSRQGIQGGKARKRAQFLNR